MTREEKSKAIEALTAELAQSSNFYLTDLSGLNAVMTSNLRRACFKANVKLSVVKNTLLEKAMEASEKDFGELPSTLKGNTSVMSQSLTRVKFYQKKKKSEKPCHPFYLFTNSSFYE